MKLSRTLLTSILLGICGLSTAASNTIQVDALIRRNDDKAQVSLAEISIEDLFNTPTISVGGVGENGASLVYTKAKAKKIKLEDGTEDVVWFGATENTEGFATIRQQGLTGRLSGAMQTLDATFELVEMQDGTVEARKVNWNDFEDEGDEDDPGDDLPDVRLGDELPMTDAVLIKPAASIDTEISIGDSSSIVPVSRQLRGDPRRAQANVQIDILFVVTK